MRTRRCRKGSEEEGSQWDAADALASTTFPRFIVSESVLARSFPPCSPDAFPPPSSSLSLFTDLFHLSLAAPDIFTASCRRVDLVCITPLLLSGPACRSPSKTVSPPRFMFPPTQRRIDPFLLSDVYVCGGASFTLPPKPPFLLPARSRASTDLPSYTTDYPRSSRSRRPPRPKIPLLRLLPRLLFSGSVTLLHPFALFFLWRRFIDSWLPYRVREIYARALLDGRLSITTSQCPEAFTSTTVMNK